MYHLEKRLKVTSWRTMIGVRTNKTTVIKMLVEISVCDTGHLLQLVTYECEGIIGAWVHKGPQTVSGILQGTRKLVTEQYLAECANWQNDG